MFFLTVMTSWKVKDNETKINKTKSTKIKQKTKYLWGHWLDKGCCCVFVHQDNTPGRETVFWFFLNQHESECIYSFWLIWNHIEFRLVQNQSIDSSCLDHLWHNLSIVNQKIFIKPNLADHYAISSLFNKNKQTKLISI